MSHQQKGDFIKSVRFTKPQNIVGHQNDEVY